MEFLKYKTYYYSQEILFTHHIPRNTSGPREILGVPSGLGVLDRVGRGLRGLRGSWVGGFPGVMGVPGVVKGPQRGEGPGVLGSPGDLGGPDVEMTSCV